MKSRCTLRAVAAATLTCCMLAALSLRAEETTEKQTAEDPRRTEWAVLPALGYNSDIGFKFGLLGIVSKLEPAYAPYRWLGQAQFQMSVKDGPDGAELPVHDHFFRLDLPGLANGRLRLFINVGFNRNIIASWYGLGNGTTDDTAGYARRFRYIRAVPYARFNARIALFEHISLFVTARYQYVAVDFWEDDESRLQMDIAASEDGTGESLYGYRDHSKLEFQGGVVFDTRNDETTPTRGSRTALSLRGAPGSFSGADFNFGGLNLTSQIFIPLYKEWLVLALQLTGDLLFGKVAFYDLVQEKGLSADDAFGGPNGVRGVPSGRYNGKVKLIGNLELRAVIWRFNLGSQRFKLGACAFFDTGRVFYELKYRPDLDGKGVGLKFGAGGGPQLLWGKSVVIRVDVAYSPDADPVGVYVEAGRSF